MLAGGVAPAEASRAVKLRVSGSGPAALAIGPSGNRAAPAPVAPSLAAPSLSLSGSLPVLDPAALPEPVSAPEIAARALTPAGAAPGVEKAVNAELRGREAPRVSLGKRIRSLQGRFDKVNAADGTQRSASEGAGSGAGASAEAGREDSSALLSRLFDRTFNENPESLAALETGLSATPFFGALEPGANSRSLLKEGFVRGFGAFFDAGQADQSAEGRTRRLKQWLAEDAKQARRDLADRLARGSSLRSETWTYIFRDNEVWEQDFRRYLANRIREKARSGRLELRLDSVGAAYGAEPYTLAIVVEEELRRAKQDPDEWDVRIRAFDKSFMSLVSIALGYYSDPEGGAYKIPRSASIRLRAESRRGSFQPTADERVHRIDERLHRWIEPVYIDLDEPLQHGVLRQGADVVFANYVLTHLRLRPAGDLAEWWLSGQWSDFGFLSMAQTLTAQVSSAGRLFGESRPIGRKRSFLSRFAATVGAIGGGRAGDSYEVRSGWRDWFTRRFSHAGKSVLRARDSYMRRLETDPFFYATVDPAMLEAVERLIAETGVHPLLTTDDALIGTIGQTGEFAINAGWLLRGGAKAAERIPLLEKLWRDQAPKEGTAPRGPPSGETLQGARLKVVEIGGKLRLAWLSRKTLEPLSDAYSEDEALKRSVNRGVTVRF
jgi:chemotaxis methyl-accepting protein methylase